MKSFEDFVEKTVQGFFILCGISAGLSLNILFWDFVLKELKK